LENSLVFSFFYLVSGTVLLNNLRAKREDAGRMRKTLVFSMFTVVGQFDGSQKSGLPKVLNNSIWHSAGDEKCHENGKRKMENGKLKRKTEDLIGLDSFE
jgi:hypothetical protein